jgi:murein DD-endopeptidase MepM/ murein hydrolase activator NlpD
MNHKNLYSLIYLFFSLSFCWMLYRYYGYYFDTSNPIINVIGLNENQVYSGDISFNIECKDDYKLDCITVSLDQKNIIDSLKINSSSFSTSLDLPSTNLSNGKHILEIHVEDAAKTKHISNKKILFEIDNMPLEVYLIKKQEPLKVKQGNTLKVHFQSNKKIKEAYINTLGVNVPFVQENPRSFTYECFVPIHVEEIPNDYLGTIEIYDFVDNKAIIEIVYSILEGTFKTEHIQLSNKKYDDEEGKTEQEFKEIVSELSAKSPLIKDWNGAFYIPCDSKRITTEFGVIRTSKERGKYRHNAIDFGAAPRSAVWAAQNGTVVLKDKFKHTGNTIILDHGCGILTMYVHLDSFASINLEDKITKGSLIGTVGMTGYATGYHLHWEMRINNIQVNPLEWVQ